MLILISPAKTLDFEKEPCTDVFSQPELLEYSEPLIDNLRKLSPKKLEALMKISNKLAILNADRYQQWEQPFTPDNAKQALLAFKGDVYLGLEAEDFNQAEFDFSTKHLRILSGLYGLLKPLDLIQPYRLEMGTSLPVQSKENLYQYWENVITDKINAIIEEHKYEFVLNLASNEYFKAINPKGLIKPVIKVDFKEEKNGEYKMISIFAKKARGLMSRFIIKNGITAIDTVKSFNYEGYGFNDALSTEGHWIFTRKPQN
jgi:cytoplasmic iron level regulating protein YaaA (DUF328/UPF0246 family)